MKGRFAPSPTGYMHLGNLWIALLSYWSTRQQQGTFVMRMEDIDTQRCKRIWGEQLLDEMEWLGFTWDEGPRVGGPEDTYWQSERYDRYEEVLRALRDQGTIYECFCNRGRLLNVASAPHPDSEVVMYDGHCYGLSEAEKVLKRREKTPSLRMHVRDGHIIVRDRWQGTHTYQLMAGASDMVLRRADGMMAYTLAVVIDDHDMGITEVVRGNDLLRATSEQICLYDTLHWEAPQFCHAPLLVDREGHRLSKRQQSISVGELKQMGYTASQILGRLAVLGGLVDESVLDSRKGLSLERLVHLPLRQASLHKDTLVVTGEHDGEI